MPRARLVIRADADARMGIGHVMRTLALGQAWMDFGGQVTVLGRIEPKALRQRVSDEGFTLVEAPLVHPNPQDLLQTLAATDEEDWLVLDGYHFDAGYMAGLEAAGRKPLVLDDVNDRGLYSARLLLNQNAGAGRYAYRTGQGTKVLAGPRYALLRREIITAAARAAAPAGELRDILVSFGGADPGNATAAALAAIASLGRTDLRVTVVAGPANPHLEALRALVSGVPFPCELLHAVPDMSDPLSRVQLVLGAAGSTCWECCLFGLPMILTVLEANQSGLGPALAETGAALVVEPSAEGLAAGLRLVLSDAARCAAMRAAAKALVDGRGAMRVLREMVGVPITLRPAALDDSEMIRAWRNHPDISKCCFTLDPVSKEEHDRWYAARLADSACRSFIAEDMGNRPVGQIRLDIVGAAAIVNLNVAPGVMGLGIGAAMTRLALERTRAQICFSKAVAFVRTDNPASVAMFENLGFRRAGLDNIGGAQQIQYELPLTTHAMEKEHL